MSLVNFQTGFSFLQFECLYIPGISNHGRCSLQILFLSLFIPLTGSPKECIFDFDEVDFSLLFLLYPAIVVNFKNSSQVLVHKNVIQGGSPNVS